MDPVKCHDFKSFRQAAFEHRATSGGTHMLRPDNMSTSLGIRCETCPFVCWMFTAALRDTHEERAYRGDTTNDAYVKSIAALMAEADKTWQAFKLHVNDKRPTAWARIMGDDE